nr:hypothetical protein [Anaerococcus lactolyticus]
MTGTRAFLRASTTSFDDPSSMALAAAAFTAADVIVAPETLSIAKDWLSTIA